MSLAACAAGPDDPSPDGVGSDDGTHICSFTVEAAKAKYIATRATCTERTRYYYSCECGECGTETFEYGDFGGHDYYVKSVVEKYLVKEATVKTSAVYYKSCRCGKAGEETFVWGSPLTLTEHQRSHLPSSLTVTLYDVGQYVYGFTYNTEQAPIAPAIEIRRASESEWSRYVPTTYEDVTVDENGNKVPLFVSKAEIALQSGETYVYRICDTGADVCTPESTIRTCEHAADSFTFAHVSDSQAGPAEFGRVMDATLDSCDFVIHTGDVVQYAHYEHEWYEMLDGNYTSVAGMPIMPIAGNHETSYNNATYETVKHFNNNIPKQDSTALGYYYSFVYGDVRFIMLNTNDLADNRLKAEQYDWLVGELKSNTQKWTVVSMHNPMYSVGKYGSDETRNAIALALRDQLGSLFAEYGVDLVLQGHDHAISRTYPIGADGTAAPETTETVGGVEYIIDPDGVIYVMNGPAGTQQRAPVAVDESLYAYAQSSKVASWAEITVSADSLIITVKYHTGAAVRTYYTWGIRKS